MPNSDLALIWPQYLWYTGAQLVNLHPGSDKSSVFCDTLQSICQATSPGNDWLAAGILQCFQFFIQKNFHKRHSQLNTEFSTFGIRSHPTCDAWLYVNPDPIECPTIVVHVNVASFHHPAIQDKRALRILLPMYRQWCLWWWLVDRVTLVVKNGFYEGATCVLWHGQITPSIPPTANLS